MLQIKSFKSAYIIPLALAALSIALVLLFPNKPPKIIDVKLFDSPINPSISVTFSEPMNKLSLIDGGFVITPKVAGDFSWSANTLFFTPRENLDFNTKYSIQVNSTVQSQEGEYLKETFNQEVSTQPQKLLYLDASGQINSYNLSEKSFSPITDEKIKFLDFDYDPTTSQLVGLGIDGKDSFSAIFIIESKSGEAKKINKLSSPDKKIHHVKWLPFENSLLISRDNELIKYDLKNSKITPIVEDENLIYEFFPSPDGFKVGYVNNKRAILLKDLRSDSETVIANQFNNYFGFSEFGSYSIYVTEDGFSNYTLQTEINLQNADGDLTTISVEEIDSQILDPALSPSEDLIAFVGKNEFNDHTLMLSALEQDQKVVIFESFSQIFSPKFSPDGRLLSFITADPTGKTFIQIYDLQTDTLKNLPPSAKKIEWSY